MIVARRVYLYGIAFATLWMLVNGLAGLLEVALEAVVEGAVGPLDSIGRSNLADQVSFYGALTGIGLVTWVIHWGLAARAVARDPIAERRSAIRKLYLYGVVLVGGLILTFNLQRLLADLLGLVFGTVTRAGLVTGDVVSPLALLMAAGAFATYHARVAQHDSVAVLEIGRAATIRRWCTYLLALVGLMMLVMSASGLIARLIDLAMASRGESTTSGNWLAVEMSGRVSTITTGLIVWVVAWWWSGQMQARTADPDPERDSVLRKVYLYGVLFIMVSWTVWNVSQVLYVLLRSLLIPSQSGTLWSVVRDDLGQTVANTVVYGLAWAYHAHVLKREALAAPERQRQATIRWIYGYIVALVGAVTFGSGVAGTLATILELVVEPGGIRSEYWWQERLALVATMILVGLPVWLIPWLRLQREVVGAVARRSLARRIYLFLALGLTVLTLLGSGAFTLYQLLRVALGERWTSGNTGDLIDAASAAAIAALLLAYHLRVFQRDAALAKADEASAPPVSGGPASALAASEPPADADTVTLLIIRAAGPDEAGALRERVQSALPPGTTVTAVSVPASEATRLLGS